MARPKKGEEKGATAHIGVRVSAELRAGLDEVAAANKRLLTDEVRVALEQHVKRELVSRKPKGKR